MFDCVWESLFHFGVILRQRWGIGGLGQLTSKRKRDLDFTKTETRNFHFKSCISRVSWWKLIKNKTTFSNIFFLRKTVSFTGQEHDTTWLKINMLCVGVQCNRFPSPSLYGQTRRIAYGFVMKCIFYFFHHLNIECKNPY